MSASSKTLSAVLALLLLGTTATYAYTLVFKDGSTLVVEKKYRIEGDRALATLLSGTETFFNLADLDLQKTEEINKQDIGSAFVLDGRDKRPLGQEQPAGSRTLEELYRGRGSSRQGIFSKPQATARVRRTPTGNLDLFTLPGDPLGSEDRAEELTRLFRRHGVTAAVRQGSEDGRILLQITTNSRGEVFSALTGTAAAMVELEDQMPDIELVEIAMATSSRSRAGMFVLDHEDAAALADGKIAPERYFLDNVVF